MKVPVNIKLSPNRDSSMNTKIQNFKALEQVIDNLELETKKLGVFSDLVTIVNATAKDVEALVTRQEGTHKELIDLVDSTEKPVKVINTLSSTLEKEINQIYHFQNSHFEQQQANLSEQFKELFKTHHDMVEGLYKNIDQTNNELHNSSQARLDALFTTAQDPIGKIKTVTEQLEQEIIQLQSGQKFFQEEQNARISEKLKSLLNIQHEMTSTLRGEVIDMGANIQDVCRSKLEQLIISTEAPVAKVQEITSTLGQTLEALQSNQSTFHAQQQSVQENLLNSALSYQKDANKALQTIVETISDEIKKIDPQLIAEMGNTYNSIHLRLETLENKIHNLVNTQKEHTNYVQSLEDIFQSKSQNLESRFTQLEEKTEALKNSLESIQTAINATTKTLESISSKVDEIKDQTSEHKNAERISATNDALSTIRRNSKHSLYTIGALIILLFFYWIKS